MSQMEIDRVLSQIRTISSQVRRPQAPVAGAGEAMGEAPVLQRVGDRATPRFNVIQYFDRTGKAAA